MKVTDIHTHGIDGFDTQTTSQDDILRITQLQGKSGVSEIVLSVYPSPIRAMREHMSVIRQAMKRQKTSGSGPARIIGIHLEGPFLNPSRCGALEAQSFLKPDEYALKKLLEGFEDIVKIMTIAPELEGAEKLIRSISDMGIIASMGHSDATYAEAESGYQAGTRGITHLFNAMRGIHHREPGLAGFGLMNKEIYVEVIADPFHLDQKMIEFIFSVKNKDRIIIVSDTVKGADRESLSPAVKNEKGVLLGGCLTITGASERLIHMGIDREAVIRSISENPQRYLHS